MDQNLKALIAALRQQGFTVDRLKSGRWEVRKDGKHVTVLAANPKEARGLRNAEAAAKRHGYRKR